MDRMCTFFIDIKPETKQRPRFNSLTKIVYTPKKTAAYENIISFHSRKHLKEPLDGALSINLNFFFHKPKSNKKNYPAQKPDIDNLVKAVLDALNGIAFKDDSQIVSISCNKRWTNETFSKEGIDITIIEMS